MPFGCTTSILSFYLTVHFFCETNWTRLYVLSVVALNVNHFPRLQQYFRNCSFGSAIFWSIKTLTRNPVRYLKLSITALQIFDMTIFVQPLCFIEPRIFPSFSVSSLFQGHLDFDTPLFLWFSQQALSGLNELYPEETFSFYNVLNISKILIAKKYGKKYTLACGKLKS